MRSKCKNVIQMNSELLDVFLSKIKGFANTKRGTSFYIAFENNLDSILPMAMGKILTAYQIADKNNWTPLAFNQTHYSGMDQIYEAFGVKTVYTLCNIYKYPIEAMKAFFFALVFLLQRPTPEKLISKKYGGILVGDLIYDQWLRDDMSSVTIRTISPFGTALKKVFKAFFLTDIVKGEFQRRSVSMFLAGNFIYTDGVYARIASMLSIPILMYSNEYVMYLYKGNEKSIANSNDDMRQRIKNYIDTHAIEDEKIEVMLRAVYSGSGDWNNREAFFNKKIKDRDAIVERLGLDPKKKNIVIMAHCFSDAPHYSGPLLYRDYYEELEETLKFADQLDNANWLLKAHPARSFYNEDGAVEELYQRCCPRKNVKWFPDEYSAKTLCEFADVLLTIQGTAGVEFACVGVPCVITANAYYDQFGFTKRARSIQELQNLMREAEKIPHLTKQQTNTAGKVLYAYKQLNQEIDDPICNMIRNSYRSFLNDNDAETTNNKLLQEMTSELTQDRLEGSKWVNDDLL